VKRRQLVRDLSERGCYLKRHGANHDLYINPANGRVVPVPRHNEIKDTLARAIRKQLGLVD
jgi:predicted RNA binding protein YcfA (HicA-like mRNA interferase family)